MLSTHLGIYYIRKPALFFYSPVTLYTSPMTATDLQQLAEHIRLWAQELGFQQVGIADIELSAAGARLQQQVDQGYHGTMQWLADPERIAMRTYPQKLEDKVVRVISCRMDYFPQEPQAPSAQPSLRAKGVFISEPAKQLLDHPQRAYISRYSLGRDYHKMMRKRLAQLAARINEAAPNSVLNRPFVDSAPVLEKPLAVKAGLGWQGKHSIVLNHHAGSYFFLGEIFTDLPLPIDQPAEDRCGSCTACMVACPTQAIVAPYVLDARRCISYLTIENKGSIDPELRPLLGNRVFGCDDCQLVCPWNKFAQFSPHDDFQPRHQLDQASLVSLFLWNEEQWDKRTQGSAIRRAGYAGWLRNLAIGLGNGHASASAISALKQRLGYSDLVDEHIHWALQQLANKTQQG